MSSIFTSTPMPYMTHEQGDPDTKVEVHAITRDNMLLCHVVPPDGTTYAALYNPDGTWPNREVADWNLAPPQLPGRAEYDNWPPHRKAVVERYIERGQKVYAVQFLRGEIGVDRIGLGESVALYDQLAVEYGNRDRYVA